MTTEFNELLSLSRGDKTQILVIGSREQVMHTLNEFYVKRIVPDRALLMPPIPIPSAPGKFLSVLER
jgi:hypothetical protein